MCVDGILYRNTTTACRHRVALQLLKSARPTPKVRLEFFVVLLPTPVGVHLARKVRDDVCVFSTLKGTTMNLNTLIKLPKGFPASSQGASGSTNGTSAASVNDHISTEDRRVFWAHYNEWVLTASNEQLAQLQAGLESISSAEVQSLAKAIRGVLQDETLKRQFPHSFLEPLRVANWPSSQARG